MLQQCVMPVVILILWSVVVCVYVPSVSIYDGVTEIITGHFAAVVVDTDKKKKLKVPRNLSTSFKTIRKKFTQIKNCIFFASVVVFYSI
jgi:hypothetical protein